MMAQNKERVLIIPNSVYLNLSNSRGLGLKWSNLTTLGRGSNSTLQERGSNGPKGQRAYSLGQRPWHVDNPINNAPQGQKQYTPDNAFALTGRTNPASSNTQGVALSLWLLPLRGVGMPQRDRLIELNKIAIQQMKVLEGVEDRRMLK